MLAPVAQFPLPTLLRCKTRRQGIVDDGSDNHNSSNDCLLLPPLPCVAISTAAAAVLVLVIATIAVAETTRCRPNLDCCIVARRTRTELCEPLRPFRRLVGCNGFTRCTQKSTTN